MYGVAAPDGEAAFHEMRSMERSFQSSKKKTGEKKKKEKFKVKIKIREFCYMVKVTKNLRLACLRTIHAYFSLLI